MGIINSEESNIYKMGIERNLLDKFINGAWL